MSGWAAVPHWVMRGDVLKTAYAKLVYVSLLDHADEYGECFPSVDTIAAECCCSRRTVFAALSELEAAGLIARRAQTREDGGRTTTRYRVLTFRPGEPDASPGVNMVHRGGEHGAHKGEPDEKQPDLSSPPTPSHPEPQQSGQSEHPGEFAEFRRIWRKKGGRLGDVIAAFDHAAADVGVDRLMASARRYVADAEGTETRFTKSPVAWLTDRACYAAADVPVASAVRSEADFSRQWEDHCDGLTDADYLRARGDYWRLGRVDWASFGVSQTTS